MTESGSDYENEEEEEEDEYNLGDTTNNNNTSNILHDHTNPKNLNNSNVSGNRTE